MPEFGADGTGSVGVDDEQVFAEVFFLVAKRLSAVCVEPEPLAGKGFSVGISVFAVFDDELLSVMGFRRIAHLGQPGDFPALKVPVLVA